GEFFQRNCVRVVSVRESTRGEISHRKIIRESPLRQKARDGARAGNDEGNTGGDSESFHAEQPREAALGHAGDFTGARWKRATPSGGGAGGHPTASTRPR